MNAEAKIKSLNFVRVNGNAQSVKCVLTSGDESPVSFRHLFCFGGENSAQNLFGDDKPAFGGQN